MGATALPVPRLWHWGDTSPHCQAQAVTLRGHRPSLPRAQSSLGACTPGLGSASSLCTLWGFFGNTIAPSLSQQRVTVPSLLVAAGILTSGDRSTRNLSVPGRGSTARAGSTAALPRPPQLAGHGGGCGHQKTQLGRRGTAEDNNQQLLGPNSRLLGSWFERFRFGGEAASLEVLSASSFLQPLLFRSGWW